MGGAARRILAPADMLIAARASSLAKTVAQKRSARKAGTGAVGGLILRFAVWKRLPVIRNTCKKDSVSAGRTEPHPAPLSTRDFLGQRGPFLPPDELQVIWNAQGPKSGAKLTPQAGFQTKRAATVAVQIGGRRRESCLKTLSSLSALLLREKKNNKVLHDSQKTNKEVSP